MNKGIDVKLMLSYAVNNEDSYSNIQQGLYVIMDRQGADILVSHEYDQQKLDSIAAALHGRKFFICVQPKFSMPDSIIIGGEAYLRWNEPGIGIIFPAEFIPAAESAGLMEILDLYALEEVCCFLKECRKNDKPIMPLSINLSESALLSPGFVDAVKGCMARHSLGNELIEFEFPMTFMRDHPGEFSNVVDYFHGHGFRCAVDGFALAPKMLAKVCEYKIDTLKLDCRAFIKNDEDGGINDCIATFNEVSSMGVDVLIEGVETPNQARALIEAGCPFLQGYSLGMPVSTRLFGKMLENQN